jgi:primosomal protein N' (replication factor Y)
MALLLLTGRNEEKVKLSADHVKQEIEKRAAEVGDLIIAGPAPAPLARAETMYRYQIVLRTGRIARLGSALSALAGALNLPDGVKMIIDIDPVNLI